EVSRTLLPKSDYAGLHVRPCDRREPFRNSDPAGRTRTVTVSARHYQSRRSDWKPKGAEPGLIAPLPPSHKAQGAKGPPDLTRVCVAAPSPSQRSLDHTERQSLALQLTGDGG